MTRTSHRGAGIDPAVFRSAVASAVLAPSWHNTQPWRFRLGRDAVEVLADRSRGLAYADPGDRGLRLAIGAAVFNLRLALAVAGRRVDLTWRPVPSDPDVLARLTLAAPEPVTPVDERLYAAITRRHSNRLPFWPDPVPAQARTAMIAAAREEGAWLDLVTGTGPVAAVAAIAQAADRRLNSDERYREELAAWTRTDVESPDGVPARAGAPAAEPQDLLPQRPFASASRAQGRDFEVEPLLAILGTVGDLPTDQLVAGYALQRVLLTVTDLSLAVSLISQPIEVPATREQLRIALGRFGCPQMVMRVGYGQPVAASSRRPVDEVLIT